MTPLIAEELGEVHRTAASFHHVEKESGGGGGGAHTVYISARLAARARISDGRAACPRAVCHLASRGPSTATAEM